MKILILWVVNLQIFFSYAIETDCRREPKCLISRTYKMKAANCYDRQFKYFPKCLNSDVEVIDLTFNRIRKVTKTDISRFSYLKFLYLADNLITNLEGDVFDDADDLETLDLSLNAITKIPPAIFKLPSMKSLYLSQNLNINVAEALEIARPVLSPLTQIDISLTTDEENYSDFPNFGILPFLAILNITGNFYFNITPGLIMGLCNLQKLINDNVTTEFEDPCDCWRINLWLKEKNVKFTPFKCAILQTKCLYPDFKQEDLEIYNNCTEQFETIKRNNLIATVSIGVGSTIGVIILLVLIICLWRRRKNRHTKVRVEHDKSCVDDSRPLNLQQKSVPNVYS